SQLSHSSFHSLGGSAKGDYQPSRRGARCLHSWALLLILGEYNANDLPLAEREKLLPKLIDLYRNNPDPGLHGAAAWLLRQWGHKTKLQQIDQFWAMKAQHGEKNAEQASQTLAKSPETTKPSWYVNGQGPTFVVLPGPVEFWMGSPATEAR